MYPGITEEYPLLDSAHGSSAKRKPFPWHVLFGALLLAGIAAVAVAVAVTSANSTSNETNESNGTSGLIESAKFSVDLLSAVETARSTEHDNVDIFIQMSCSFDLESAMKERTFDSRAEQTTFVYENLRRHANETQAELLDFLSNYTLPEGGEYRSMWIRNGVYVMGASVDMLNSLALRTDVSQITSIPQVSLNLATSSSESDPGASPMAMPVAFQTHQAVPDAVTWNVERVGAPVAWDQGVYGEGVVVAVLDTGVLYFHEALKAAYRGAVDGGKDNTYSHDYNAFMVFSDAPGDENGHGTHVAGVVAGDKGIGIAPKAKYIIAQGLNWAGSGSSMSVEMAAQFVLCPTRLDGTDADCSRAPHLVSNSWGGNGGDGWFYSTVSAWIAAGIVPVFAAGNSGPQCATMMSPADYANVIAVGASTELNSLADFSSRGPAENRNFTGDVKPDITAPGQDILSAYNLQSRSYAIGSGTSMAAPHVTGSLALILSALWQSNPAVAGSVSYPSLYKMLTTTTYTDLNEPQGGVLPCSDEDYPATAYPNYYYGYGLVDVGHAVSDILLAAQ